MRFTVYLMKPKKILPMTAVRNISVQEMVTED